ALLFYLLCAGVPCQPSDNETDREPSCGRQRAHVRNSPKTHGRSGQDPCGNVNSRAAKPIAHTHLCLREGLTPDAAILAAWRLFVIMPPSASSERTYPLRPHRCPH